MEIEFKKIFPSVIIGKLISDKERLKKLNLNKNQIEHLTLVISYASSLEAQGSMPRYGWVTEERIIVPSEIYTKDVASKIFELALNCLNNKVFSEIYGSTI